MPLRSTRTLKVYVLAPLAVGFFKAKPGAVPLVIRDRSDIALWALITAISGIAFRTAGAVFAVPASVSGIALVALRSGRAFYTWPTLRTDRPLLSGIAFWSGWTFGATVAYFAFRAARPLLTG